MTAFETDLEHDRKWLEANPGTDFIHVTRATGTHMIGMPDAELMVEDEAVPHLFGMARPSEVYRQRKEMLTGSLRQSGRLWLLCEGGVVRKSNAKRCIEVFERRLRVAERRARKSRLAAA